VEPLTLDVNGRDVTYTEPGKARAAARQWTRMARDLDSGDAPEEARAKVRELRARAKAANDWARRYEDAGDPRPHEATPSGDQAPPDDDGDVPPSRRRAAAALTESGIRRTRKAAKTTRQTTRRAARRYERAGGPNVSTLGEFLIFFVGSVIGVLLIEDVLSKQGTAGVSSAVTAATGIAHRVIAPVPIVSNT